MSENAGAGVKGRRRGKGQEGEGSGGGKGERKVEGVGIAGGMAGGEGSRVVGVAMGAGEGVRGSGEKGGVEGGEGEGMMALVAEGAEQAALIKARGGGWRDEVLGASCCFACAFYIFVLSSTPVHASPLVASASTSTNVI